MKIGIKVLPRKEVLDTQGRAVQHNLFENGFLVKECAIGKYILLDIDAENLDDAKKQVGQIAEYVLYNPLIENYEIEELNV